MRVFSGEWLQQIQHRYDHYPDYKKPHIHRIATSNELQSVRDEIEQWLARLPEAARGRVVANVRSARSFRQTYHELAVGHILRRLGYEVEYEKAINNLTPDWHLEPKDKIPPFLVEVFTANQSE